MSSAAPYSVLAIGLGSIFERAHLPVIRDLSSFGRIVGVEQSGQRREFWRLRDPRFVVFGSLNEALRVGQYDCAVLTTYPKGRATLLQQVCDAGITKVLCEKPLAIDRLDLDRIRHLIHHNQLDLVPCHTWMYAPFVKTLDDIATAMMKRPFRIRICVERTRPALGAKESEPNWRTNPKVSGGGILFDHGYHSLYLAQYWTGYPILAPLMLEATIDRNNVDWETKAVFKTSRDDRIELCLTWAGQERHVSFKISSEDWALEYRDGTVSLSGTTNGVFLSSRESVQSDDGIHQAWYKELYQTFLAMLSGNRDTSDRMSQQSLAVNLAILDAVRLQTTVGIASL